MSPLVRHLGFLAAAALACFYVIVLWKGPQGIPAMMQMRKDVLEQEAQNRKLRERLEHSKRRIRALENDPLEREKAVREGTNKQRPGETTIYLSDPDPGAPPQ